MACSGLADGRVCSYKVITRFKVSSWAAKSSVSSSFLKARGDERS